MHTKHSPLLCFVLQRCDATTQKGPKSRWHTGMQGGIEQKIMERIMSLRLIMMHSGTMTCSSETGIQINAWIPARRASHHAKLHVHQQQIVTLGQSPNVWILAQQDYPTLDIRDRKNCKTSWTCLSLRDIFLLYYHTGCQGSVDAGIRPVAQRLVPSKSSALKPEAPSARVTDKSAVTSSMSSCLTGLWLGELLPSWTLASPNRSSQSWS